MTNGEQRAGRSTATILIGDCLGADHLCGLANAETYVHMTRTLRWMPVEYERWRYRTWRYLATVSAP